MQLRTNLTVGKTHSTGKRTAGTALIEVIKREKLQWTAIWLIIEHVQKLFISLVRLIILSTRDSLCSFQLYFT